MTTLELNRTEEDLRARIDSALNVLSLVRVLPDAGQHGATCHIYHHDCLVVKVRNALVGE